MSKIIVPQKTTHIAVAPDGTTFTRTSARSYTHAVLCYGEMWHSPGQSSWGKLAFSGRQDLAEKEARKWIGHWEQVVVVPVTAR